MRYLTIFLLILLSGCENKPKIPFWLNHVHAIGCDQGDNVNLHKLSLLGSDNKVRTMWIYYSPKCEAWKSETYWNLELTGREYEGSYDLVEMTK